jgi:hypothetical protein
MAGSNPHAASGTGSPRNPYLYTSLDSFKAGVALDPFSLHALTPEARERIQTARAKVLEAWAEEISTAEAAVINGEEVPAIVFVTK